MAKKSDIQGKKHKTLTYKITILDFSATHMHGKRFDSDAFYASLANRLYPIIDDLFSQNNGLTCEVSKRLAITLACYVEDLVSGCGVWSAFTSLHEKKYGRKLPFFNLDNPAIPVPYDDELPSLHAVQFLVWYIANGEKSDTVVNPHNPALAMLSMQLLPLLMDAYDEAPDSPARPMIMPEEDLGIPLFYQIRNLCHWLCTGCYLTRVKDTQSLTQEFRDYISKIFKCMGDTDKGKIDYAVESFMPLNARIGPLALPAYEWLAEIVDLYHEDGEECYITMLREMKSRPYEYYKYLSVDGCSATLADVTGEKMIMSAYTLPGEKFMPEVKVGASTLMSMVYFDGAWLMNCVGIQALAPEAYECAAEKYQKNRLEGQETYMLLMKNLKNKRMGVCADYKEYMSKAFGGNVPDKKVDPAILRDLNESDNLLYFVNSDGTASILPGWGQCVKIRGNKSYDKEDASADGISLICNHDMSTPEMREYLIDNNMLPDAAMSSVVSEAAGRRLFQENIRFLNDYYSRNSMPFIGNI